MIDPDKNNKVLKIAEYLMPILSITILQKSPAKIPANENSDVARLILSREILIVFWTDFEIGFRGEDMNPIVKRQKQ